LVSPGKDVTLYIPSDTPPQVINYMNRLKAEGIFSQGIMDILTKYVLQDRLTEAPIEETAPSRDIESWNDDGLSFITTSEELQSKHDSKGDDLLSSNQKNFSPEDIFRQAERNAGKLLHDSKS
jgi:hypothetical protein